MAIDVSNVDAATLAQIIHAALKAVAEDAYVGPIAHDGLVLIDGQFDVISVAENGLASLRAV